MKVFVKLYQKIQIEIILFFKRYTLQRMFFSKVNRLPVIKCKLRGFRLQSLHPQAHFSTPALVRMCEIVTDFADLQSCTHIPTRNRTHIFAPAHVRAP